MAPQTTRERSSIDDIIDVYKKDVDLGLLLEGLKLTVEQRLDRLASFIELAEELRASVRAAKSANV
jgi:hypothetical protein